MLLSPKDKFRAQRGKAKQRGIGWELTFEQWIGLWNESGKFALRGRRTGQFVMARNGDSGPYAVWNVKIKKCNTNLSEAYEFKPCGGKLNLGKGRGWTLLSRGNKRYQVMARGKHIGTFFTQEEAEAAYQSATTEVALWHSFPCPCSPSTKARAS